ncbi:hypothetical protein VCHC17A1_3969B, partial [Vibrio cholerae HC-17A1]
DMSPQKLRE